MKCHGVPLIRLEMSDLKVYSTPGCGVRLRSEQFTAVLLDVCSSIISQCSDIWKSKHVMPFFACSVLTSDLESFSCLVSLRSAEVGVAVNWPYHPCVVLCGTVPSCWKLAPTCGIWLAFQKMKQKLEAPRQSIVTDSVHDNCQTGRAQTQAQVFVNHKLTASSLQHRMPISPFPLLPSVYVEGYKSKCEVPPNFSLTLSPNQFISDAEMLGLPLF